MNNCDVKYCGKDENGKPRYWCTTHKDVASDKDGNKLEECLCTYKEIYDNKVFMEKEDIKNIKLKYENVLDNLRPRIFINDKQENNALKIKESLLDFKDIAGLMIAKLNNIDLESSYCTYCGMPHTDDGLFAYTPHARHLCQYCGYFYNVDKPNIGNEFALFFDIPNIKEEDGIIEIEDKLALDYDAFNGILLINNKKGNTLKINNEEISVKDYLNKLFKDEY